MKIEPIKNTVMTVMQGLAPQETGGLSQDPWGRLKKALTKTQLRHIKFNYLRKGVLGLYVDSSSWLYSLNLEKENLLEKLNSGSPGIKDIRFRIGKII